MEGTPYIFQGEEIGMTNANFARADQYRDVETINFHGIQLAQGVSEASFLAGARANSRDNARTPMQWSAVAQSGFTKGTPWIAVNENFPDINAERDRANPDGVFAHYQRLIALRREHAAIRNGEFELLLPDHPQLFAFERRLGSQCLLVIANMSAEACVIPVMGIPDVEGRDVISGRNVTLGSGTNLEPFTSCALWLE